jgi:hypothetical protein
MTNILKGILKDLLKQVSPEVRDMLRKFMVEWKASAAETPNWYDDLLVDFIWDILGFNE